MKLIRVGVDLAKNVFQVHGVERSDKALWRRKLTRESWLKVLLETVCPAARLAWSRVAARTTGTATAGARIQGEARFSGAQSQPPWKPARRSPATTYGQRRMMSQIRPVR